MKLNDLKTVYKELSSYANSLDIDNIKLSVEFNDDLTQIVITHKEDGFYIYNQKLKIDHTFDYKSDELIAQLKLELEKLKIRLS